MSIVEMVHAAPDQGVMVSVIGLAVRETRNRKLGHDWGGATYRPVGYTCSAGCPLLNAGCYAQRGHAHIQARRSGRTGLDWGELWGVQRVRWDVSGDCLLPDGSFDVPYMLGKLAWHAMHPNGVSLGYTHSPGAYEQVGYGPLSGRWPESFHLWASCDSMAQARYWQSRGWRTARVSEELDADPETEVYCPIDKAKHEGRPVRSTCSACQLCFNRERNDLNIVFLKN